jgi:transposase
LFLLIEVVKTFIRERDEPAISSKISHVPGLQLATLASTQPHAVLNTNLQKRFYTTRGQLHTELQQLDTLQTCLDKTTATLDELNKQKQSIKLLETIPGIGPRTAEAIVAVIDDPHRFDNCRQVSNYVGFTPRRYQSGQMDRSGRISKRGNPLLRALLVQASWAALRFDWAKEIYKRVCRGSAKRRKIAIIAVARHLLMRCWAMLRDNKPWQYKTKASA